MEDIRSAKRPAGERPERTETPESPVSAAALEWSPGVTLPTRHGAFEARAFRRAGAAAEHVLLLRGRAVEADEPLLVRIHSECVTGDVFGSERCDCRSQLEAALASIAARGRGMVVYLRQEGRGIGLIEKLRAYELQEQGLDTWQANVALGHPADARDYGDAVAALEALGVRRVELITANPRKVEALRAGGIAIAAVVPAESEVTPHNERYLRAKSLRFGR